MWFGTKSRMSPMSAASRASLSRRNPSSPPSSGLSEFIVDDVIAMRAARARLKERRSVDVTDAESLEVGHDCRRSLKAELGVERQAIGRKWNRRGHQSAPMLQNTDHGGRNSGSSPPQIGRPLAAPSG